ncbi:MAG TPA: CDP-alcohol phosphatidyltransferase family protein [Candidatus Sphingobacterium stercoripullorum]|nr:CDP-alcohol phosphatidyltransferase family protein [Candidatus Sphingobacterium stercoripullorum]
MIKKHIPNSITLLNLFSGCVGALFALKGEFTFALYAAIFSGIFDFFDGMVARLLKVNSPLGLQLDSLADMVSFGFLPGAIIYTLLGDYFYNPYVPYLGFLITMFSALRLAKFNLDERQSENFIGLNTPMNTFVVLSLPFAIEVLPHWSWDWLLIAFTVVSSLLLISEIKLFSMKIKSFEWAENKYRYGFLLLSLVLLILLQILAIPIILLLYFLFSFLYFSRNRKGNEY